MSSKYPPLVVSQGQALSPQVESMVRMLYDPPHCTVRRASTQAIVTSTNTVINFLAGATVEADTHGMFATGTPDRLTVQVPGIYRITVGLYWAANTTGARWVWVTVAGTTYGRTATQATSIGSPIHSLSCEVAAAAGAVIQMLVWQNSGADLNTGAGTDSPRLSATWVRP